MEDPRAGGWVRAQLLGEEGSSGRGWLAGRQRRPPGGSLSPWDGGRAVLLLQDRVPAPRPLRRLPGAEQAAPWGPGGGCWSRPWPCCPRCCPSLGAARRRVSGHLPRPSDCPVSASASSVTQRVPAPLAALCLAGRAGCCREFRAPGDGTWGPTRSPGGAEDTAVMAVRCQARAVALP